MLEGSVVCTKDIQKDLTKDVYIRTIDLLKTMKDVYSEVETMKLQTKDRAQKIVAALYLLTNHIDIENPIRTEIRTSATLMLKSVLFDSKIDDLKNTILSFLSVAVLTKEVSTDNAAIIEGQLQNLKVTYGQVSEPVLSHLFIHEKERVLAESKETKENKTSSFLKPTEATSRLSLNETAQISNTRDMAPVQKPKQLETSNQAIQRQTVDPQVANKKDEKKARRVRVLEHLSKTELKTIKDVSKFFNDCSEKTIQRELNDLVEERAIVRVGDRRWSTYKLA